MQGLIRRYLGPEMFLTAGLVLFVYVLVTFGADLDERTGDALLFAGLGVFALGLFAMAGLAVSQRRRRDRAWRAACQGAGLQPVDAKVLGLFRPEFPDHEGHVKGHDVLATHDGAEGGEVWL